MMTAPDDAALRGSINEICRALAVDASLAQVDDLADFLSLLQKWNATYNLTAVRDPAQMLVQHLADCLAMITPLRRRLAELGEVSPLRLLDVGSGGGLPGAVVAIMQPGLEVTCVDTVGKKAAFTRQVAGELTLRNLHAEHARVEQLVSRPFDVITSRAFASLGDFVELTRKLLSADGVWLAMKGKHPEAELAALPANVTVFHVEQLEVPGLNAERCLIWMRPTA
ncbi:16S rRNA (guanine(527)-N(7))-methyltransferase RsmG [soil metagenome]